jgi:hypothetical protein
MGIINWVLNKKQSLVSSRLEIKNFFLASNDVVLTLING